MRISKIKYENFRNFKNAGYIDFSLDGSLTVIYGPNGVGKTTLHQLFQWIFYGEVHFNKTASNKMYNLQYEKDLPYGASFSVKGTIDFEQPNPNGIVEYYSLSREWEYQKDFNDSKKIKESLHLLKKVGDDWRKVDGKPEEIIENLLPSGLSQYFFFDGESMIADLNQKGKDSAKSLRNALYTIFDLNVYEQALAHIGNETTRSTVIGKLYLEKADDISDKKISKALADFKRAQYTSEQTKNRIDNLKNRMKAYKEEIDDLSEKIGGNKSTQELEKARESHRETIKILDKNISSAIMSFGSYVANQFSYLLLTRVIEQAQFRISLKVEDDILIPGLRKELLEALKEEEICICGNKIGDHERDMIDEWLTKFPPLSYKYIYDQFKTNVARWSKDYDPEEILKYLDTIFDNRDEIDRHRKEIVDIDDELRNRANVDSYIQKRSDLEKQVELLESQRDSANRQYSNCNNDLKKAKSAYDSLLAKEKFNKKINLEMEVMNRVREYFDDILHLSSRKYSAFLKDSIQELLDQMLTSVRTVNMSPQFELSVKDSYNDEAKSEGQFAVVSFAYIGGIFKLLSEVPDLKGKEYPLVLDGPFSKLDAIQRQNVINTIPAYAPQIILFSKDDLTSCFGDFIQHNDWTIYSNEERNVSEVKKGYDQEVFVLNEV